MSVLKRGTLCVIIGGCPENIGMIVEVLEHLGAHEDTEDAYLIQTVTGRNFHQLWSDNELLRNYSTEAITDRHKLRPLIREGINNLEMNLEQERETITI